MMPNLSPAFSCRADRGSSRNVGSVSCSTANAVTPTVTTSPSSFAHSCVVAYRRSVGLDMDFSGGGRMPSRMVCSRRDPDRPHRAGYSSLLPLVERQRDDGRVERRAADVHVAAACRRPRTAAARSPSPATCRATGRGCRWSRCRPACRRARIGHALAGRPLALDLQPDADRLRGVGGGLLQRRRGR